MISKIVCSLVVFYSLSLAGQTIHHPISSPYTGLGAYSFNYTDVFSFTANPAAQAQIKTTSAAIHSERKFMVRELNNSAAAAALKMKMGSFGARIAYSGFADYNETQAGVIYARKLTNTLDVGVHFNYYSIKIAGYGNYSALNFAIGYLVHLNNKLHFGIQAYNPFSGKFGKNEQEKLASIYSFGFGYEASSKFFVSAVIEKEEDLPVNVLVGFIYKFHPQYMVRGGIISGTSNAYFAFGFTIKSLRFDVITNYHPMLGITPSVLFLFNFKSGEN